MFKARKWLVFPTPPLFNAPAWGNPLEFLDETHPAKTRRVVNAAARILTGTRKFDRGLVQLMHDNLHWLDVPERVKYTCKVIILTRRCLIGTAPENRRRGGFAAYILSDRASVPVAVIRYIIGSCCFVI